MPAPLHKPIPRGQGSIMRFGNDETEALIEALRGCGDARIAPLLRRFELAHDAAQADRQIWAEHRRLEDPLGPGRMAMRGWALASRANRTLELYVRSGDFLRDEEHGRVGWQCGLPGAFEGRDRVISDAWQACLVSRSRRSWEMVGEPRDNASTIQAGLAALAARTRAYREGPQGHAIEARIYRDVTAMVEILPYYAQTMRHVGAEGDVIGSRYGETVRLVSGTAIVTVVTGCHHSNMNAGIHPTVDLWTLRDEEAFPHAERTGPMWITAGRCWSIRIGDTPDYHRTGHSRRTTTRDAYAFPVFATPEEAIADAAVREGMHMDVLATAVDPKRVRLPSEDDIQATTLSEAA